MAIDEAVTYFVRYQGITRDPATFVEDYSGRHVAILSRWPGIRRIVLHVPTQWHDPHPVRPDRSDLLTEMTFANEEAFREALRSEARTLARLDTVNLKHGDALVTHQAMRSLRYL